MGCAASTDAHDDAIDGAQEQLVSEAVADEGSTELAIGPLAELVDENRDDTGEKSKDLIYSPLEQCNPEINPEAIASNPEATACRCCAPNNVYCNTICHNSQGKSNNSYNGQVQLVNNQWMCVCSTSPLNWRGCDCSCM